MYDEDDDSYAAYAEAMNFDPVKAPYLLPLPKSK